MPYILFIMLFVTVPSDIKPHDKNTVRDHRIWSLQTTSTIELETSDWCKRVADSIEKNLSGTSTITARTYCIPKSDNRKENKAGAAGVSGSHQLDEIIPIQPDTGHQIDRPLDFELQNKPR